MSKTIIEKILSEKAGRTVVAGDEVIVEPDLYCAYDYPGWYAETEDFRRLVDTLGLDHLEHPEKMLVFIDHFVPGGNSDAQAVHARTRELCRRYHVRLYEGMGIGHQVLIEEGHVTPGALVFHFDSNINTIGALGACGMGIRNALVEAIVMGCYVLEVPETFRLDLVGSLPEGVCARDAFLAFLSTVGPAGCRGMCLEVGGEGARGLEVDDRCSFSNMAMYVSATSCIFEPDAKVDAFLEGRTPRPFEHVLPDPDASYAKRMTLDLGSVEPMISLPPYVYNVHPLAEKIGMGVDVGFVGTCSSGRVEDFKVIDRMLEGREVAAGFRLELVPASKRIERVLADTKVMGRLLGAGARFIYPSCDTCFGLSCAMSPGEKALSTGQNTPGRKGCLTADIYLASPSSIAAAATCGRIVDPRELLR